MGNTKSKPNEKYNKNHLTKKGFQFGLSFGKSDLTMEGNIQIGWTNKTVKNYTLPQQHYTHEDEGHEKVQHKVHVELQHEGHEEGQHKLQHEEHKPKINDTKISNVVAKQEGEEGEQEIVDPS